MNHNGLHSCTHLSQGVGNGVLLDPVGWDVSHKHVVRAGNVDVVVSREWLTFMHAESGNTLERRSDANRAHWESDVREWALRLRIRVKE